MPYQELTLAQLQTELATKFDGVPFWVPEQARLALNETLRYWNLFTGQWRKRIMIPVPAASPFIPLAGSLVFNARVEHALTGALEVSSIQELDLVRPSWRNESTVSGGGVPTSPNVWAPCGVSLIAVWPRPPIADQLLIDGVSATPTLVLAGDFVDIGKAQLGELLGMALHILAFNEGGTRFQATMPYRQAFYAAALETNSRLAASKIFRRIMGGDQGRFLKPATFPARGSEGAQPLGGGQA